MRTFPSTPVLSFLASRSLSSGLFSSPRLRLLLFFFPDDFCLPADAPFSSFFRSSATRAVATLTPPSFAPFSIAPLIQLLFDHSMVHVMSIRVEDPPAHIRQYFVMTWNEDPEGTSGVVVVVNPTQDDWKSCFCICSVIIHFVCFGPTGLLRALTYDNCLSFFEFSPFFQ